MEQLNRELSIQQVLSDVEDPSFIKVAKLYLLELTPHEISNILHFPVQVVHALLSSPDTQKFIESCPEHRRIQAMEILETAQRQAALVLFNAVSDPTISPQLKIKAALEILDRLGISPIHKSIRRDIKSLDNDTLNEIKSARQEARALEANVIDVTQYEVKEE